MNEEIVRQGEWNEALCFWTDKHPRTEIAAQFCHDHWNIWYVSSGKWFVIAGNIKEKDKCENIARKLAEDILNSTSPLERARNLSGRWYD